MTSFSGYQFKVLIDYFQRARQSMQHHSLYLHFAVFGLGAAVDHIMAGMAAKNTAQIRRLLPHAGNMALANVAQHHCVGIVTAVAVDAQLAVLAPGELTRRHRKSLIAGS